MSTGGHVVRTGRRQAVSNNAAPRRISPALVSGVLWLALAAFLLAGSVYGAQRLLDPATFPVRNIKVTGELRYLSRAELRSAVESHVGLGLLRVNVDVVRGAVEALPWVRNAQVRRVWPEGLVVVIEEQTALARWGEGGLVSDRGVRFAASPGTGPEGLPELNGPDGTSRTVTGRYREFSARLAKAGKTLAQLELDQRNAWRIRLADGLVIDLGREDVLRRLDRFARLYQSTIAADSRRAERVDLRYANGFAVQFTTVADGAGEGRVQRRGASSKGELANAKKA